MKNEIREVQKYFEEKISNGFYRVVSTTENGLEIAVDGYTFNFGLVENRVYQYTIGNFMMLNVDYVYPTFLKHDLDSAKKRMKLEALELLTKEIAEL